MILTGNPYRKGRISTVDLLVLPNLDQLLLKMQTLLTFLHKHATLMRRSTVLSLPLQLAFPESNDTFCSTTLTLAQNKLGCFSLDGCFEIIYFWYKSGAVLATLHFLRITLKNVNNHLSTNIYSYLETSGD